jgi:hypothetical protein
VTRPVILRFGNAQVLRAATTPLNESGVELIDENGGGPGVRLRKQHKK